MSDQKVICSYGKLCTVRNGFLYGFCIKILRTFAGVVRTKHLQITPAFGGILLVRKHQAKSRLVFPPDALKSYHQHRALLYQKNGT